MKAGRGLTLAALLFLAVGCASNREVAQTGTDEVQPYAAQSYLQHKEKEVQRLERRIADLNMMAADQNRRYQGSHDNLRRLVSEQNTKLDSARADLAILKEAKGPEVLPLMARLDNTLDDMRTTLNLMVAE